jgi:hypothetical protein
MTGRARVAAVGTCVALVAAGCTSRGTRPSRPDGLVQQLWAVAGTAAADAESEPAAASAVRTTERRAAELIARRPVDEADVTDRPVWLIQVRGRHPFSCECSVVPGRSGDATANYLLVIASATTRRWLDGAASGLFAERQDISTLGREVALHR